MPSTTLPSDSNTNVLSSHDADRPATDRSPNDATVSPGDSAQTQPQRVLDTTAKKPVVLVTGAAGLIGSKIVQRLTPDHTVVGLDLKPPESSHMDVHWYELDLTEQDSVDSVMARIRDEHGDSIASVIHLAAYYDFSGAPSSLYHDLTVDGTRRMLRALQAFRVDQFIFSSTLLVQRSSEEGHPVTAFSPTEAEWDYPKSKLAAEAVIKEERHKIPTLILRIAGVYDDLGHSPPITQQIKRIHEKELESYFFPGDKTHGQSFIHLDDLTECLRAAVERRAELPPREILVIGEEDVMSYEELQDSIGELIHGKQWPTIRIPKVMAKAGAWTKEKLASGDDDAPFIRPWMIDLADQNYPVDLRRASDQLRWYPRHTLRSTLPVMIEHLRRDPKQWYETNHLPLPQELRHE
ncbi:MAG: NAD(P)-dependent oxidoreductase [Planctomycetales bacterium]|nr:NAD(P)-dependent oxidoreductase [Planctomycetales bacterium]